MGSRRDHDARRRLDWLREEELAAAQPTGSPGVQGVMTIGRATEADWTALTEA
jgi:hypothetical protein